MGTTKTKAIMSKKTRKHSSSFFLSSSTSSPDDTISTLIQNIPSEYIQPILEHHHNHHHHHHHHDDEHMNTTNNTKSTHSTDSSSLSLLTQLTIKTQETLRLFNSKTTPGQPLCNGDSIEARSVVILQFVLRNGFIMLSGNGGSKRVMSPSIRIPLSTLAKIVGIGKKDIEKVGQVCALILQQMGVTHSSSSGSTSNNNTSKLGTASSSIRTRSRGIINRTGSSANNVGRSQLLISSSSLPLPSSLSSSVSPSLSPSTLLGKKYRNVHERNAARFLSLRNKKLQNLATFKSINGAHSNNTTNKSSSSSLPLPSSYKLEQLIQSSSSSTHIQTLCIKLQSYLHDPNNIELKSKLLWSNLIRYKVQSQRQNSRLEHAVVYDLQTHQVYYEGACFYVTVQDLEHGLFSNWGNKNCSSSSSSNNNDHIGSNNDDGGGSGTSYKGRKKKSQRINFQSKHVLNMNGRNGNKIGKHITKSGLMCSTTRTNKNNNHNDNNNNTNDDDDDDDENVLSIEHIIHELRIDESFFSDILDEVTSSVRDMGSKRYHDANDYNDNQKKKKKKLGNEGQTNDSWTLVEDSKEKGNPTKRTKIVGPDDDENDDDETMHNHSSSQASKQRNQSTSSIPIEKNHFMPSNSKAKYVNERAFLEWKQTILSKIISDKDSDTSSLGKSSTCSFSSNDATTIIRNHARDIRKRY